MAYERRDEALRQLKTDREREEAAEELRKKAGAEAEMRFVRIKSAVADLRRPRGRARDSGEKTHDNDRSSRLRHREVAGAAH
jgi:hypothetical protein